MTRSDLRARILEQLNDSATAPIFWEIGHIDAFLQEAQEVLAEEVRAWRRTVFVPKRAGWQFYDLALIAPDCMAPFRIIDQASRTRLHPTTPRQLNGERLRWLTVHSTQPERWYPLSWAQFGVWPATAQAGGLLEVEYLAWPTAMGDDVDTPELADADQDSLVLYGVYAGLMQQYEAQRAAQLFVRFVTAWTDTRARNDVEQLHSRLWQRQGRGNADRR